MAALQQLEFFLLRYSGDASKTESINLGVVAIAPTAGEEAGFADVRFIRQWPRIHCFDPLADVEELQAIEREIRQDLRDPRRLTELLARLSDAWSNSIRFDLLQGCLTDSPTLEMERLSAQYLETPPLAEKREIAGRQKILIAMRDELQKAGVLAALQVNVPVAQYTKPGDPLKLDFGYMTGENYKFLHAVSLGQRYGVEQGTMLAARFPGIAAGIRNKKGFQAWLTAVVDDDLDSKRDEVTFTVDLLQEHGIAVTRASDMQHVAKGIRADIQS
jgi:hypothetical protein